MINNQDSSAEFLSIEDLRKIDSTNLSQFQRHYLRVLAHCLISFKKMSSCSSEGPLPNETMQLAWLSKQGDLFTEKDFADALIKQFGSASKELEDIANQLEVTPLELTIDDLIRINTDV